MQNKLTTIHSLASLYICTNWKSSAQIWPISGNSCIAIPGPSFYQCTQSNTVLPIMSNEIHTFNHKKTGFLPLWAHLMKLRFITHTKKKQKKQRLSMSCTYLFDGQSVNGTFPRIMEKFWQWPILIAYTTIIIINLFAANNTTLLDVSVMTAKESCLQFNDRKSHCIIFGPRYQSKVDYILFESKLCWQYC